MELSERMAKTAAGQVTWARPELGKRCEQCKHVALAAMQKQFKTHVCQLVKVVSGKNGVPYDGKRAIACSKFEAVDSAA